MEHVSFQKLDFLLKAPSKESVVRLCNEAFILRNTKVYPKAVVSFVQQMLSLQTDLEAQELMLALSSLVKYVLFQGSVERSDIATLFPDDFNKNLAALLVKIFVQRLPQWKHHAADNLVFLPRLVDFDWRVDIKTSSDSLSRMSVPTCLVQLQIQDPVSKAGSIPPTECVNVELSQQTLDTMLDGLGRIRDQLSSVAAK